MKRLLSLLLLLFLSLGLMLSLTGCGDRAARTADIWTSAGFSVKEISSADASSLPAVAALGMTEERISLLADARIFCAVKGDAEGILIDFPSQSYTVAFLLKKDAEGKTDTGDYETAVREGRVDDNYLLITQSDEVREAFYSSEGVLQRGLLRITTKTNEFPVALVLVVFAFCFLIPYAIGNINIPTLVCRSMHGEELSRILPDAPPSLAGAYKMYGRRTALLVLLGEGGVMALCLFLVFVFLGADYNLSAFSQNSMAYIAGAGCILGQVLPVKRTNRGASGFATLCVMIAMLSPITFGVLAVFFVLVLFITHYFSLAVITAGLLYPLMLNRSLAFCGYGADGIITMVPIFLGLLILYSNRGAIARIRAHSEPRLTFRRR